MRMLELDRWCCDADAPFSFASRRFKGTSESKLNVHLFPTFAEALAAKNRDTRQLLIP